MKKMLLAFLLMLLACLPLAGIAEETPFPLIEQALTQSPSDAEVWTREELDALLASMESQGFALPESIKTAETLYKYDLAMDLLEAALGNHASWSIQDKNRFDQLMVKSGQLTTCFNLLPDASELPQEAAVQLALQAIKERLQVDASQLDPAPAVSASYVLSDTGKGMWAFGIELSDGTSFDVQVDRG